MTKPLIASHLIDGLATAQQQSAVPSPWGKFRVNAQVILGLLLLPLLLLGSGTLLGVIFGDWNSLNINNSAWLIFGGLLLALMLLAGIVGVIRGQNGNPDELLLRRHATQTLLAALHTPDDTLLPIFLNELTVPSSSDPKRQPLGPLRGLQMAPPSQAWWEPFYSYIFLPILIWQSLAFNLNEIQDNSILETAAQHAMRNAQFNGQEFWTGIAFFALLLLNFLNIYRSAQKSKWRQLWFNGEGLWWRRWPRWVHLPWADIRTIGYYRLPRGEVDAAIYVLATDQQLVSWRLSYAQLHEPQTPSSRLLAQAMTTTGLPLRDLAPLAETLVAHFNDQRVLPVEPPPITRAAAALLAQQVPPSNPTFAWWEFAILFVTVAAYFAVPPAGVQMVRDRVVAQYLQSLPTQIHAQPAIFHDTLLAANGLWPVHAPTASDPRDFAYTSAGYRLRGNQSGQIAEALLPQNYGAVAMQVTVTESGTILPGNSDGVGIVLRYAGEEYGQSCAFMINYSGNWNDTCTFESGEGNGSSVAIQHGPDATNTILVVERANFAIFYVNGRYVGQYFARYSFTGTLAQVGLINDESGMSATFRDFTIWRVNMPPTLPYVG